jgi:cell division protein FtsB
MEPYRPIALIALYRPYRACGVEETPLGWQELPAVSSLLTRYRFHSSCSSISCEGTVMRKNTWMVIVASVMLSFLLTACQDTKTLQENAQLKAQVADLQKENDQLENNLQAVTAARDTLTKENEALKAQINGRKTKRSRTKASTRKPRRS